MNGIVSPIEVSSPRDAEGESYPPSVTKRGVIIVLTAWCVYSLIAAVPLAASYRAPFFTAWSWQLYQSAAMFGLSIPVWFIVIRHMHRTRWYLRGLVHLILGPAYALAGYEYLYQSVRWFAGHSIAASIQETAGWLVYSNLILYILQFALFHSYEILRRLRLKEKLTLELLALRKEQELATLKAQINPHFFFNTLNSISAMASTDAEETRTMIAQLADLLRYATDSTKKDFVPLKDELKFVRDYVALETRRMGDRLSSAFQVDGSLASHPVPPMILQPLVENAIRHGISPLEEGGSIRVEIHREGGGIAFHIADTGVGLSGDNPLTAAAGVGLKNTDARLRKVYGEAAGLRIQSRTGRGCEVAFTLPIR
jgi:two-component system, LytTR family, sensor kinase